MLGSGKMLKILPLCLWIASVLGQRESWLTPDGSQPDNADAYNNADLVTIAWNAMEGGLSDLWLNAVASNYAIRLGSNINISDAGTYPWTITVGDEEIDIDEHFELSFVPTGTGFTKADTIQYQQSPVFVLVKRGEPIPSLITSSISLPGATSAVPTTMAPTSTSFTSGPSSTAQSGSSSGMSDGLRAGIAIGVVVAVLIICGLLFWALRLRRRVKAANNHRSSGIVPASGIMPGPAQGPTEKRISGLHEVKGDTVPPVEMNARPKTVYHELSG